MVRTRAMKRLMNPENGTMEVVIKDEVDSTICGTDLDEDETKELYSRRNLLLPLIGYILSLFIVFLITKSAYERKDRSISKQACNADLYGGDQRPYPRSCRELIRSVFLGANPMGLAGSDESKERKKYKKKASEKSVDFPNAYTSKVKPSSDDILQLNELSKRVQSKIPDIASRGARVLWGGSQPFWMTASSKGKELSGRSLGQIDGGPLLWNYFIIMTRYMKDFDDVRFPFKLCKSEGCAAEQSIEHTLEWREKYQPWYNSPSMLKENANGWVYNRGFSPAASSNPAGRHAMMWLRPGMHTVIDDLAYFRCILHSADKAIAESLRDSSGQVGKFNVLVDATDYAWHKLPDFKHMKQAVTMLQDHYPNRLGMLFLVNMSRSAEFVVSLIKPIITKEVREKIHIVSHNPKHRDAALKSFVSEGDLPTWLGGSDEFTFNAKEYYPKKFAWSDTESTAFLKTMPYHDTK